MSDLRKAAEMALEALESVYGKGKRCEAAIKELRQAIEKEDKWKDAVLDAISCDVDLATPARDYESMSPLDCYEAGLLDGSAMVRKNIKDKVSNLFIKSNPSKG